MRIGAVLALCTTPVLCASQAVRGAIVRADLAALDPSNSQGIHLAWSAGAGWQWTPHSTLFLEVSRQNLSEELGGESAFWQTYLGGAWEYAFGAPRIYQRQFMVTVRGGVLIRQSPLDDAPYLGAGLGFRYPVTDWLHFEARIEDDLDLPKQQTVQSCLAPNNCSPVLVGGHLEQNLGLFLGAAVHP